MINGLEGIPGSGKSYEAVVFHVLEALKKGRMVVTNLPLNVEMFLTLDPRYGALIEILRLPKPVLGTWDATRMDEHGNGQAFKLWSEEQISERVAAKAEWQAKGWRSKGHAFGGVWDYYHTWKHPETGQGPLFVIDECHVPLPKMGADPEVIEYYKLHRHFNSDVLLMTQSVRHMCPDIAILLAMLIRCRKADFLGKPDEYVRKTFAGYRGAEISREKRKYLPQFFPLYRSHTQGGSVAEATASDVKPFLVKWKRAVALYWIAGIGLSAWLLWPDGKKSPPLSVAAKPVAAAAQPKASAPAAPAVLRPERDQDRAIMAAIEAEPEGDPEPLKDKGLHLKGVAVFKGREVYLFAVSQNGQHVTTMTVEELRAAGYSFRATGACTGTVQWKNKARPVVCDFPSVNMPGTKNGGWSEATPQTSPEQAERDGEIVREMRGAKKAV